MTVYLVILLYNIKLFCLSVNYESCLILTDAFKTDSGDYVTPEDEALYMILETGQ